MSAIDQTREIHVGVDLMPELGVETATYQDTPPTPTIRLNNDSSQLESPHRIMEPESLNVLFTFL